MKRRSFLIGCGGVVAVLVAGCGLAAAVSQLPAGEHPDVDFRDDEITAAREAVIPELEARLDAVERRFGAEGVGQRGRIDRCEAGFDDFTRQDRYAFSCRMRAVQLMPVAEPFRRNASRLGEALLEGDCPDGTDVDRALAEPFSHVGQIDGSRGDCTPGVSAGGPEIIHWLPVAPSASELGSAAVYLNSTCSESSFRPGHCEVTSLDLQRAAAAAPPDAAYIAIVVADEGYFSIPWECPWPASWFRENCGD